MVILPFCLGTFLEGETILVMAGFAAYRGYLDLPLVIGVAFAAVLWGINATFCLAQSKEWPFWRDFHAWPNVQPKYNGYCVATIPLLFS